MFEAHIQGCEPLCGCNGGVRKWMELSGIRWTKNACRLRDRAVKERVSEVRDALTRVVRCGIEKNENENLVRRSWDMRLERFNNTRMCNSELGEECNAV